MNELNQNEQLINDMITEQQPASAVKLVNPVIDADQASPVREAASSTNAIRGEPGILRQQTNKAGANNKLLKSQKSVNFIEENNFAKAAKDQASEKKEASDYNKSSMQASGNEDGIRRQNTDYNTSMQVGE